jgi:hypothetical protein
MEGSENRSKADRFLPKGSSNMQGALSKMQHLFGHTELEIGVPLREQVYRVLANNASPSGMTVHEVASLLSLNTKTCAKVLDEMALKYEGVKSVAHRYGRVYMFKYLITQSKTENPGVDVLEDEEYLQSIDDKLLNELDSLPEELKETVYQAMFINLKAPEQVANRNRVTHQSFMRALYIIYKLKQIKVTSVYEMKEMIKNDLEPNAKWNLDKRTVLRIIWKLQRVQMLRQMCYRITLRKDEKHDIEYIGDDYESIEADKKNIGVKGIVDSEGNTILHKTIITLPHSSERDSEVLSHSLLQNPTNRKPIVCFQSLKKLIIKPSSVSFKHLKEIVAEQNLTTEKMKITGEVNADTPIEVLIERMEETREIGEVEDSTNFTRFNPESLNVIYKAYKNAILAKFIAKMYDKLTRLRIRSFFSAAKPSRTYVALKKILNFSSCAYIEDGENTTISTPPRVDSSQPLSLPKEIPSKYSLAYTDFCFSPSVPIALSTPPTITSASLLTHIPRKKRRRISYTETQHFLSKILFYLIHNSGSVPSDRFLKLCNKLDVDSSSVLECLESIGYIEKYEDGCVQFLAEVPMTWPSAQKKVKQI